MRSLRVACFASLIAISSPALADSISPVFYEGTTTVGGTLSLTKTVTVSAGTPTTAKADIFFLTDTTGSMGSTISTVRDNFSAIASSISGDIGYGVGQFKDVGDSIVYNLDSDITTDVSVAQAAIATWGAGGGGDTPEQALYALGQVAETTSWRSGAKKIVVLAGDAPAQNNLTTVTDTAATLIGEGVTVESIDVGYLNSYGQFDGPDSIYAAGVSGEYFTSFGGDLVSTIQAAIGSAFANYSNITLEVVGATGVGVEFTPLSFIGDYDRSIERTFDFDLTFTGLTEGVHEFSINALVDGGIIASQNERITVLAVDNGVPEPASWAMMIAGFGLVGTSMRRRTARMAFAV